MAQSCTQEQLNALLEFLVEHKELGKGVMRTMDGRIQSKRLWDELATLLNSMNGAKKTVQQWQKVWTDRKHLAKKNAAALRKEQTGTGGGPSSVSLSQWELRVFEIMGEGFGAPQTTAYVPAFPIGNLVEEVNQPLPSPSPDHSSRVEPAADNATPGPSQRNRTPVFIPRRRHSNKNTGDILINMEKEKIEIFKKINDNLAGLRKEAEEKKEILNKIDCNLNELKELFLEYVAVEKINETN